MPKHVSFRGYDLDIEADELRRSPQTPLPRQLQLEDEIYVWDNQRFALHGPYVVYGIQQINPRLIDRGSSDRPSFELIRVTVWQSKAHREAKRYRFFAYSEGHGNDAGQWRLAEELSDEEKARALLPPFDRAQILVNEGLDQRTGEPIA